MTTVLRPLPSDQFVRLADQSGLHVSGEDLDQLARRKLLQPFDSGSYSRLHLYVLALYFDTVRVERHPWSMRASERSLEEVKTLAERVQQIAKKLESAQFTAGLSGEVSALASEIDTFIETVNPFGSLANVFDLVREDILDTLGGQGRLYAELRAVGAALEARSVALDESLLDPQTREVPQDEAAPSGDYPLGDLSGLTDGIVDNDDASFASLARRDEGETTGARGPISHEIPLPVLDEISAPQSVELDVPPEEPVIDEVAQPDVDAAQQVEEAQPEVDEQQVDEAPAVEEEPEAEEEPAAEKEPEAEEELAAEVEPEVDSAALAIAQALEEEISNVVDEVVASTEIEIPLDLESDDDDEHEHHSEQDEEVPEPLGLDEDSEDFRTTTEIEAVQRDADNPFAREPSTGRTQALLERLEEIKAQKSEAVDDGDDDGANVDDSLESKVLALNERREQLIREQDWAGLVALYENQIDLFEEPADRHAVLLTLATLYELKSLDHERAFECFSEAFEIDLETARRKTLDSMRKIGTRPESVDTYIDWLEARVSTIDDAPLRRQMQRDLAKALEFAGQSYRAFLSFAAFLAGNPSQADGDALDLLDELSLEVGDDELGEFYHDLLGSDASPEARVLIGHRAGSFFQSCNQLEDAADAFRVAFDADPTAELAFSKLTMLYERLEAWGDLRSLLAQRLKTADDEEAARLRKELSRVVQNESSTADLLDRAAQALQADPNNDVALERLMRVYANEGRFTDAYAHLNRLLDADLDASQEVRIRQHLANVAFDHLESPEEASHHLETALSLSGPNREVLESLANIRLSAGEWSAALSTLRVLTGGAVTLPSASMRKWLNAGIEAARNAEQPDELRRFKEHLERESRSY